MWLGVVTTEPECQNAGAELWAGAKISAHRVHRKPLFSILGVAR
jgi:hypothetical protein